MEAVSSGLAELARTDLSVVFQGETGVGKECLVRMLHASSPRAGSPFVAINCAAIPPDLLEAELFGIRKGVATAVHEPTAPFHQPPGRTLLPAQIAHLPPRLPPN